MRKFYICLPCLWCCVSVLVAQTGSAQDTLTKADQKPASVINVSGGEVSKIVPSAQYGIPVQPKPAHTDSGHISADIVLHAKANHLAEVVVTSTKALNEKPVAAGKIAIDPMDLPQSVTVIGKDVLQRQQALRLSEALMNVNGVYVYGTTGGQQEELGGRGYAFNSSNTFKNGARYNNGTMPEMSSLEKVEVLKGSAAILFGNVAAGGVLNLITKKPTFDKGGEVAFRTGSYGFYKPSVDIYGPVGKSTRIAYRLNATYEKSNSFRDDVKSKRFYVNPSLLFKAGKKTDILLEGDYLHDDRTLDYGTGAINYTVANIPRSKFLGAKWSYYKTRQTTATATITHRINEKWELRNITSYQRFNSDGYGTTRPNSGNFVQPNGMWVRGLQRSGTEENYYITQLDLTGKFNTGKVGHQLLAGADADKYETNAFAYLYSNPALGNKNIYDTTNIFDDSKYLRRSDMPGITAITITRTPTKRAGLYVQDLISLTGKLKVLAGVRYTYQQTGGGYIDSLQKQKQVSTILTKDNAFTPRFGIVYQPVTTVSLFTSYANSFTLNTGTDVNLQALPPSYINQYEAGIKTELFKKVLSANLTAYRIVNSNLAQTALTLPNGAANNNTNIRELAGQVTSKGVELDLMSRPVRGISFIGGYSFNETKYTKSNTYIQGSKLRYNPQHTANASIYYAFCNRNSLKGLNVGLLAYYVGKRVAGRSTRIQVANDTYKLMDLPDYMQFDASVGYTIEKFSIRLKLSNLLNKLSYYVHDDNSVNPIAPRQLAATASFKF